MQSIYVQRLRLTFTKEGSTRYIGHLDLARALERAFNRAKLPLAYSQGFNPRPKMQMASALPLGYASKCELVDILMTEKMELEQARTQIMKRMAPGIVISGIEDVPLSEPALQMQTVSAHYTAILLDPVDLADLNSRIAALIASETHVRELVRGSKRKSYDLRPLIKLLSLDEDRGGHPVLDMELVLMPSMTGRPDELLQALDIDPLSARISRTKINLGGTAA